MRKSRLSKNVEKRTKKTITLSIIGIVIVLFLLLKFGIEILVNFSLLLSGGKALQNSQADQNQISYIAPPILNPLPSATDSARIIISGKSSKNMTVILYINSANVDQVQTDNNGNFTFSENLNSGDNQIETIAQYNNKKSDFSNSYDVLYKNSPPALNVSSPSDGQNFNKNQVGPDNSIVISGKTDPGATVTVNGYWAVIDNSSNFSYTLPLQNGDNQIKIIAVDQAGNKTEKDLKVNFSP